MTEKEKMIAGELYISADQELVELRKQARLITEKYNQSSITQKELRLQLLTELFGSAGKNIYIEPSFSCDY